MSLLPVIDLRMAFSVWHRNVAVYRRTWVSNILPNFFESLLYLVGMGVGVGFYVKEGIDFIPRTDLDIQCDRKL